MGDNTERHIHVWQCEINFFRSLGRHCKVRQDNVDLSCLQIFNPAGRLGRDIFKFHAQVLCDPVAKIYIISLIFAVLIHIAEGALVGEYTDRDLPRYLFPQFLSPAPVAHPRSAPSASIRNRIRPAMTL